MVSVVRLCVINNLLFMVACASLSGMYFGIGLPILGFLLCILGLVALYAASEIVVDAVSRRSDLSALSAAVNVFAVLAPLWIFTFTFSTSVVIYAATGEATVGLLGVMFLSILFPIALTEQWRSTWP
jgi:hypothetical protein